MKHNSGKMPEITRNTYNNVRKYDRRQFEDFCRSLYECGLSDGAMGAEALQAVKQAHDAGYDAALIDMAQTIGTIKGIGPKKLEEIREAINKAAEEKKNERRKEDLHA